MTWGIFFEAGSLCVLNFFHTSGLAPSGGHILSSPEKKEYGKKDAARVAGCSPPYGPTPLGGGRWCGWVSFDYQANLQVHPCPDSWCAGRLPLRCCLRTAGVTWGIFFVAGSFCVLNFYHAIGLSPSGGHILSSPAKKEYGKKDAARVAGVAGRKRPSPSICVANALFD